MRAVAIPVGETTSFIRDFRVHVVRPHELQPRPADQLLSIAAEKAIEKTEWSQWRGVSHPEEAEGFLRTSQTPWYDDFRNEYFRAFGPSDHEYFYHPVACLSVVEATAPEPIRSLEVTPARLPPFFREPYVDSNIHHCYVLLHDVSEASQERADAVFRTMRETFGMEVCKMLRINSQAFTSGVRSSGPAVCLWWRQQNRVLVEGRVLVLVCTVETHCCGVCFGTCPAPSLIRAERGTTTGYVAGYPDAALGQLFGRGRQPSAR